MDVPFGHHGIRASDGVHKGKHGRNGNGKKRVNSKMVGNNSLNIDSMAHWFGFEFAEHSTLVYYCIV